MTKRKPPAKPIEFVNPKGTVISIVSNTSQVAEDARYFIMWNDVPKIIGFMRCRGADKVTSEIAKELVVKGLLKRNR